MKTRSLQGRGGDKRRKRLSRQNGSNGQLLLLRSKEERNAKSGKKEGSGADQTKKCGRARRIIQTELRNRNRAKKNIQKPRSGMGGKSSTKTYFI